MNIFSVAGLFFYGRAEWEVGDTRKANLFYFIIILLLPDRKIKLLGALSAINLFPSSLYLLYYTPRYVCRL